MERENWKQIIGEEIDLPETDSGEYSLDEILLQFRFEYSEQETEEKMARETEQKPIKENRAAEENSFTEDAFYIEDMDVREEPDKPEMKYTSEMPDFPEEEEGPEESDSEINTAEVDRKLRVKSAVKRSGSFQETLKTAVRKFWKREKQAETPEHEALSVEEMLKDSEAESVMTDEQWDPAEEDKYPEIALNTVSDTDSEEMSALEDLLSEKPGQEETAAADELINGEAVAKRDTDKDLPEANDGVISRKKARKVLEDFPDTHNEDREPVADTIDYSALFKMFTEDSELKTQSENISNPDTGYDAFDSGSLFENIEWNPLEDDNELKEQTEDKPVSETVNAAPLFAESTGDNMDFRDILREFMLGDQHPIYADMPGIGKKAQPSNSGMGEPTAAAEETKESLKKRTEKKQVEEDFPLNLEDLLASTEKSDFQNTEITGPEEPDKNDREEHKEDEPELPEPENAEEEKGFRRLFRGFGIRPVASKKRALNEPKAYASFEDYIPEEEKEVPAEKPAGAENETTVPTEPEPSETDAAEPVTESENITKESSTPEDRTSPSEEEDEEILFSGDFPSFGQWILNELMTLWIRINGIGNRESTATMEDDAEELGREVNVANASRYYGSQVTMLRMRFQIGLVLLAILSYITLGFPVSGMLKTAKVTAAMCLGLQLTVMLLCLDVVTNAAINLTRRKFGADALAVLFCVISSFDALAVAVGGFGTQHVPLCMFSSLALMGVLLSSLLSARALRKSMRVPAIGKRVYCVTAEEGVRGGGDLTLLKSVRPSTGFVRRAEEAPPDESLFARIAPVQLLAALVLTLLTAIVKRSPGDILYILSAILSCAIPVTALLAFALPYFIGSERIFSSGAAVAGWSGIHDIGCSRNLIVTDRDLFPEDTVAIETVRIFADDSAERVIGFAGTMIAASGSGLGACFAELMEKNNCRMRTVEDFRWLAGGGLQGHIEGHLVLCGSSDLMQLMNVKIPYRLVDSTTVLLAIDGVLYGIFKINYTGLPEIRSALQELIASNRHPIFAIRDFNITPDMLHDVFDVATDGYDFPPYGDRFRISEAQPSDSSKVSAVVCREGLGPLTHLADTGRSMYVAIRINLMITFAIAMLGMLLVFLKLIGTGILSPWLPFVLMLLDAIVVALVSLFMRF